MDPSLICFVRQQSFFLSGRSSNSHLVELRYTSENDHKVEENGNALDDDEDDIYGDEETVERKRVEGENSNLFRMTSLLTTDQSHFLHYGKIFHREISR